MGCFGERAGHLFFLDQIGKQEERVAGMQKELDQEKSLLSKLQKAKAALEA